MKVILLLSSLLVGYTIQCSDSDQKTVGDRCTAAQREYESGQEKLMNAIFDGDRKAIDGCVAQKIFNTTSPTSSRPPALACAFNLHKTNIDLLKYMLNKTVVNSYGTTQAAFNLEESNETGMTPLYRAIEVGDGEVIKLLFDGGGKITQKIFNNFSYLFGPEHEEDSSSTKWLKRQIAASNRIDIRVYKCMHRYQVGTHIQCSHY